MSELLEVTVNVQEGTDTTSEFSWTLNAGLGAGGGRGPAEQGFIDAMNTATMFLRTTGNVVLEPTNSLFLSNPAFVDPDEPTVIPLPATGLLLIGAVAGLASLRRRVARSSVPT
jgi:hypothetical protein